MEDKTNFVRELGELFAKYKVGSVASYEFDKEKQIVIMTCPNGHQKFINVYADSLAAIVVDLGKQGGIY